MKKMGGRGGYEGGGCGRVPCWQKNRPAHPGKQRKHPMNHNIHPAADQRGGVPPPKNLPQMVVALNLQGGIHIHHTYPNTC